MPHNYAKIKVGDKMNIGNCKNCNKIFSYEKLPFCDSCQELFLTKIKKYINENGISSTRKIFEETNVPLKVIEYFISQGVLEELQENTNLQDDNAKRNEQLQQMKQLQGLLKEDINIQKEKKKQKEKKNQYHFINNDNIKRR